MSLSLDEYIAQYPDPQKGPCVVCGAVNYALSMGGPHLCSSCDVGNFGPSVIERQGKEIIGLRKRIEELESEIYEYQRTIAVLEDPELSERLRQAKRDIRGEPTHRDSRRWALLSMLGLNEADLDHSDTCDAFSCSCGRVGIYVKGLRDLLALVSEPVVVTESTLKKAVIAYDAVMERMGAIGPSASCSPLALTAAIETAFNEVQTA